MEGVVRIPLNDVHDREMFRAGVGLVIQDDQSRVLALKRRDVPDAWQLPQGGIKPGEAPEAAAWRELREETGLGPEHVSIARASDFWTGYELPEKMRSEKTGRGQVHKWFVFELRPRGRLPDLPTGLGTEFVDRRWATFDELIAEAIHFRQPVYKLVAAWVSGANLVWGEPRP